MTRYTSKKLDDYKTQLDIYFERRHEQQLGVPRVKAREFPSLLSIASQTGIPAWTMRDQPDLMQHITDWAQQIGFGLTEEGHGGPASNLERGLWLKQKAYAYLLQLRQEGKKLPQNPNRAGTLFWAKIARDSGVPINSLAGWSPLRKIMINAIDDLGMKLYPETSITFGDLLTEGSKWRMEELKGKSSADAQLYNTRTALRNFMRNAGERGTELKTEDFIGAELLDRSEETIRSVAAQINCDNSRRKFCTEMTRWTSYYLWLLRGRELPQQFGDALDVVVERAGISINELAKAARVPERLIYRWINGERRPAHESFPLIRQIEEFLSLRPNTLTSRVVNCRKKYFPSSIYPEYVIVAGDKIEVRNNPSLRADLRPLLPNDYESSSNEERSETAAWLIENLILPTTVWGRWHKLVVNSTYAIKELPPVVSGEVSELVKYKRALLPPAGMQRTSSWSEATEIMFKGALRRIIGVLALPVDDGSQSLYGLGLDTSKFCIAMFTCTAITDYWIRWNGRRRSKSGIVEDGCEESYSENDLIIVQSLLSLLRQKTGWMRQKPELARHLKPVSGFIDEAFIVRAIEDWDGICNEAYAYYRDLEKHLEDVVEEQRDTFEPILSLLDRNHPEYCNPIKALRIFSQNIIDDLPEPSLAPVRAAKHIRNYLVTRILPETVMRSRNLRELTYREDNTGQLRRRGDKWIIVISWRLFKNKHSSFFGSKKKKHDYERELKDRDGLYSWIEKYIRVYRPLLLEGRKTNIFFVSTAKRPLFTVSRFSSLYRRLTMLYFAYNPFTKQGVPGVKTHGPHAVRDMFATFVIQETGSYDLAAYVIGDAVETVKKHYTRFMPKDKMRLIDSIINCAWDGQEVGNYILQQTVDDLLR